MAADGGAAPTPSATPDPQPQQTRPPAKRPASNRGVLIIILALIVIGFVVQAVNSGNEGSTTDRDGGDEQADDEPNRNLRGRFLRWEAVDDARGFAYFEVTNSGPSSATAECTIRVSNDFGNFGFDILVGERVPAGETISGRIPIDVGEGSLLVNQGEVTDC